MDDRAATMIRRQRGWFRDGTAKNVTEAEAVTSVDPGIVAGARHGNIRQARVNELPVRGRTVDMDQYAVGRGALGAIARDCIAVVEMRMCFAGLPTLSLI